MSSPFVGDLVSSHGTSQGDQFFGTVDLKSIFLKPLKHAVVHRLHQVHGIDMLPELWP